ncbi:MAG: aromatic acid decarboxylase [Actinobacteria bacterium HGW-Actinobacteria-7]|jgi:4-hydroxy-3-polyprenylbenzoate decarboxylase|nr:MAG: aromatic acid decarboxylase [Actinobacteria bacterium HGW-Actinobacteria-7]
MARVTVVVTGASGSVYGMRLTEQLITAGHEVVFCATQAGREVTAFELGFELPTDDATVAAAALAEFLELPGADRLRVAYPDDLFDPIASGSYPLDAVVVCPASMGFCASVAAGLAGDLPERAADVALKERRPLVMVPREMPFSLVHLRNLTGLAEAGAIIAPANPAFYNKPQSIDDLVSFVVGKVLDVLGVEHDLYARWGQ